MIVLPREDQPANTDWTGYGILIQGDPGIGKSGFCASIPGYLLVDPERGLQGFPGLKVDLKNWADHQSLLTTLSKAPKNLYKGICLDSLNISYDHCMRSVLDRMRLQHPGEAAQGQAWNRITGEFIWWLREMTILGYHIIATCHTNIIEIKARNIAYNRWIPAFAGGSPTSTYAGVLKVFKIVGFMTINEVVRPPTRAVYGKQVVDIRTDATDLAPEETRVIHFDESPYWYAKDTSNQLPKTVILTDNWREDWSLFMEAWGTGDSGHIKADQPIKTTGLQVNQSGEDKNKDITDNKSEKKVLVA